MKNSIKMVLVGFALAFLLIPMSAHAQTPTPITKDQVQKAVEDLDKQAQSLIDSGVLPGVAVAVVFQDKVVFSKGYGVREEGKPDKIDADTAFQLASVSKPVGATVVAELVGEDKITWDSKISDLDPSFQMFDPWVTNQITIRDLYAHRSGLPEHTGDLVEDMGYDRTEVLYRLRYQDPNSSLWLHVRLHKFWVDRSRRRGSQGVGLTWEDASAQNCTSRLG